MKNQATIALVSLVLFGFYAHAQDGWKSLFDGQSLKGWKRLSGTADYKVENGNIVGTTVLNSGNTFLVTDAEFADFILEMDVKMEDTTSNSGIQVRSHYNLKGRDGKGLVYGYQFELDPSSRRWSGGIYDEGRRDWLYPGALNQDAQDAFKIGEYNHIKIQCTSYEMKTWINGRAVAYLVDSLDRSGFIGLQVHAISKPEFAGEKVYFKNIRIKTFDLKNEDFPPGIYVVNTIPNHLTS